MLKIKSVFMISILCSSIFFGAQSAYSFSNFVSADPVNPYGGQAVDPLPITATIFTVTNGKIITNVFNEVSTYSKI